MHEAYLLVEVLVSGQESGATLATQHGVHQDGGILTVKMSGF
jgi:hypothetical protein